MAVPRIPCPTVLVNPEEILSTAQIRDESVRLIDLAFTSKLECVQWLAKRRLLRNFSVCQDCGVQRALNRRSQNCDGYMWKCRRCVSSTSIRKDSFFVRSRLSLQQILIMVYGWSRDYPQKNISHEARVGGSSNHTIVDWCSFCRDICEKYLIDHPTIIGGIDEDGTSKVVTIEETNFFQGKCIRGPWRKSHWVFGGIEQETGRYFVVEVPDRTVDALSDIIQLYVAPGSIIISDDWSGYNNVRLIGGGIYEHQVVTHGRDVQLQSVWMCIKRKLRRQFGTSEALFASYLNEIMWKNIFRNSNIFGEFLITISEQYSF